MSSKTIDGMPRELLERIAQWGSVTWMDKNELRAFLAAPVVERQELIALLAALKAARQFIINGTELGFIRMPEAETPDPAHDTLLMIERAIADLEALVPRGAAMPGPVMVDLPAFDGYQAHIVRELQAVFVQECEKAGIKVRTL